MVGPKTIFVAVVVRELAVVSYRMKTAPDGVVPENPKDAEA